MGLEVGRMMSEWPSPDFPSFLAQLLFHQKAGSAILWVIEGTGIQQRSWQLLLTTWYLNVFSPWQLVKCYLDIQYNLQIKVSYFGWRWEEQPKLESWPSVGSYGSSTEGWQLEKHVLKITSCYRLQKWPKLFVALFIKRWSPFLHS